MAYPTVADVRAEGLSADPPSDDRLAELIAEAVAIVEKYCNRKFIATSYDLVIDGPANQYIWLPDTILSITTITERHSAKVVPATEYAFDGTRLYLDPYSPDFTGEVGSRWLTGRARYQIVCSLGMSETPADINRAIILYVLEKSLPMLGTDGEVAVESSRIISEKIDEYSYQLDSTEASYSRTGILAMDRILRRWKRPYMGVAVR